MKPLNKFILFFVVFISLKSYATIHYVSHSGSSTPPYLTWETAADTIQNAINVCSPGDTVLVANGVYHENLIIQNIPVYLLGSSMDSTIIDGTGLGNYTISTNTYNSYGSIENFNIYGKGENADTAWVLSLQNSSFEIRNCQLSQAALGIGADANITAENIILKNLRVRGFSLFGDNNNIVSNCLLIFDKESANGIEIGFAPNGTYHITNNIILFTNDFYGGGNAISIGDVRKVYTYNNFISGRFSEHIYEGGISDTSFIKNNILTHKEGTGYALYTGSNKSIINNSVFLHNSNAIGGNNSTTVSNYNLFWLNNQNLHNVYYGDSDMVRDPMFVKDTLPNPDLNFDYHLQAFSPGIDKGDPNILDVDGTRSDIGMFGGPYGERYTYEDLAPRPPVNLSAIVDTNGIYLKWNKNTEADTAYYNVYRDTTENFTLDSSKIIGTPADTFFTDTYTKNNRHLYYKITSVDKQGNQSGPSEEIEVTITSVKDKPYIISNYRLYQNYPNPFNPTTRIGYRLKEGGYVKLMVYDILGKLVKVLVNKQQNKGYYEVNFDAGNWNLASGIYIYRIEIIGKGNIPKFTDMKKMILIK